MSPNTNIVHFWDTFFFKQRAQTQLKGESKVLYLQNLLATNRVKTRFLVSPGLPKKESLIKFIWYNLPWIWLRKAFNQYLLPILMRKAERKATKNVFMYKKILWWITMIKWKWLWCLPDLVWKCFALIDQKKKRKIWFVPKKINPSKCITTCFPSL